ncbi:hypothetical protein Tco_0835313, partial [Tanacetum coccineum]
DLIVFLGWWNNDVGETEFCTSPELMYPGVIKECVGPELICTGAGGDTGLGDERSMTEVSVKEQMKKLGLVSSLSSPSLSSLSKCSLSTSSKSAFLFSSGTLYVVAYVFAQLFSGSGKSFGGMVHSSLGVAGLSLSGIECSDSGSDLCIEESTPASLVSVICHPVEVRVGCYLEADASDSLGFIELWSLAFGGGLADPEAAESDLLLFVDLPWFDPAEGPSSSSSSSSL